VGRWLVNRNSTNRPAPGVRAQRWRPWRGAASALTPIALESGGKSLDIVFIDAGSGGGGLADGWFVAPTLSADVEHESHLARPVVYRPVQVLLRLTTETEVLTKANDTPYGLSALGPPADPERPERLAAGIDAGIDAGGR
jgi:acyl-CoA reductase-like NAD-dependent aldehyde dehydrogenase